MPNTTTTPKGKEENRTGAAMEQAKEVASQAMDKSKEVASSVGNMVSDAASAVGKKADNLTSSAGTGIKNLGETLSQKAPHEGVLGNASQTVANTITESGRYLEEAGLSGLADDVTGLIRRNPVPAVLLGLGIGFLLGRALRS